MNLPQTESPLDLRPLNKYSSLQATNQNGLRTNMDRIANLKSKDASSGEISQVPAQFGLQQSALGVDLNSVDSSKSSGKQIETLKQATEVRHSPVNSSINVQSPGKVEQG